MSASSQVGVSGWIALLQQGVCALALVLGSSACGGNPVEGSVSGDETGDGQTINCQPGSVIPCSCDGLAGTRLCLDSGVEFSACRCGGDASTTTGAGTSGSGTTDALPDTQTSDETASTNTESTEDSGTSVDATGVTDTGTSTGTGGESTDTGESTGQG
jgi:hypothetical protein